MKNNKISSDYSVCLGEATFDEEGKVSVSETTQIMKENDVGLYIDNCASDAIKEAILKKEPMDTRSYVQVLRT